MSYTSLEKQLEYVFQSGDPIEDLKRDIFELVERVAKERANYAYYSVKEVAEMFGIEVQSVYKWIHAGKIEAINTKPDGVKASYVIPRAQIDTGIISRKKLKWLEMKDKMHGYVPSTETIRDIVDAETDEDEE